MIKLNLSSVNDVFVLEDTIERISFFQKLLDNKQVVYTDDADIAINKLTTDKFDLIFLDHDLDNSEKEYKTGLDVIKCLKGSINEETTIIIHSMNPVGAAHMAQAHPFNVVVLPFHLLFGERVQ